MTPSEFARAEVAAAMAKAAEAKMDQPAVLRALLDAAAATLAEVSGPDDARNELTFIANNLGDDEDYSFMRP